jgi:hypothetical protein
VRYKKPWDKKDVTVTTLKAIKDFITKRLDASGFDADVKIVQTIELHVEE